MWYIVYWGNLLGMKIQCMLIWVDEVFSWVILVNISLVPTTNKLLIKCLVCDMVSAVILYKHCFILIQSTCMKYICYCLCFAVEETWALIGQMVKNLPAVQRPRFDPWVGKIPWRREWQPTPVFLSREFHGQRSLAGHSPWGRKELDMTEWLTLSFSGLVRIKLFK